MDRRNQINWMKTLKVRNCNINSFFLFLICNLGAQEKTNELTARNDNALSSAEDKEVDNKDKSSENNVDCDIESNG